MKIYQVFGTATRATGTASYLIDANSPEEALKKVKKGEARLDVEELENTGSSLSQGRRSDV